MKRRIVKLMSTGFFLCFLLLAAVSHVSAYSSILSFGDSLTDNGNGDGYGIMHFSDGPTWVEYLSDSGHLNLPLLDVAYGGATTGWDNPAGSSVDPRLLNTGLLSQVTAYLALTSGSVESSTLITLWAGANDFFNGRSADAAVENVVAAIHALSDAGGRNFLVMGLPDIGATPMYESYGPTASEIATAWSVQFNTGLGIGLDGLMADNACDRFFTMDMFELLDSAIADPAAYGFGSVNDIFWADGLHPSTRTHLLIADMAMGTVNAPVPEPATWILLVIGAGSLTYFRKKR
jgi:outer membrane lipase/esterase